MQATLIVVEGAKRTRIPLKLPTTIGRGKTSKLRVRDSAVSRKHCEVIQGDGCLLIQDLGSSNGTTVNGRKIDGPTILRHEDLVSVGPVTFRFEYQNTNETELAASDLENGNSVATFSDESSDQRSHPHLETVDTANPTTPDLEDDNPFDFGSPKVVNESAVLSFRTSDEGSEVDIENVDDFLRGLQEQKAQPAGESAQRDLMSNESMVDSDDSRLNQFLRGD